VQSVHCGKPDTLEFVISTEKGPLKFHRKSGFAEGFSDTIWYGSDHFSICRHLDGMRAIIQYRPPDDASYDGNIAGIQIRDDLPATKSPAEKETAPHNP
jgi:hypothetical protein